VALVVLVALAQPAALFLLHRADLDAFVDANASWYSYQNLPREMLRDHLLRSLLYLQQTPPASNLFMGLALRWFSWPAGVAYSLNWLQTVVCVLGAVVLMHVLALLYPGRAILWTVIGLLFLLNTDLGESRHDGSQVAARLPRLLAADGELRAGVSSIWSRCSGSREVFDPLRMHALLVAAICCAYRAALVNLVETLENMRYRLEVEPLIWLIALICVTELAALIRRRPPAAVSVPAR